MFTLVRIPSARAVGIHRVHGPARGAQRRGFGLWLAGSIAGVHADPRAGSRRRGADGGARRDLARLPRRLRVVRPDRPLTRLSRRRSRSPARHPHHARAHLALLALGANPFDVDAATIPGHPGRVVGRPGHRRAEPDPGAPARWRAHRDLRPRQGAPRSVAQRIMVWFSLGVTGAFTVLAFTNDRYPRLHPRHRLPARRATPDAQVRPKALRQDLARCRRSAPQQSTPRKPAASSSTHSATIVRRTATAGHAPHFRRRAIGRALPEPFPYGDPWNECVLANQLMHVRRFEDAAHYAAEGYRRQPHTLAAGATVARAAAERWKSRDGDRLAAHCGRGRHVARWPRIDRRWLTELTGVRGHPEVDRRPPRPRRHARRLTPLRRRLDRPTSRNSEPRFAERNVRCGNSTACVKVGAGRRPTSSPRRTWASAQTRRWVKRW